MRPYIIHCHAQKCQKKFLNIFKKLKAFRRTRHFFVVTYMQIYIYTYFFFKMCSEIKKNVWDQNQGDPSYNEATGAVAKTKISKKPPWQL